MTFSYCFTDTRNIDFPPTFDPYISPHYSIFFQLRHKHSHPMMPLDLRVCAHTNSNHNHSLFCQKLPGNTKHKKGWRDFPGPPRQQQCRDLEGAAGPHTASPSSSAFQDMAFVKSYKNLGTTLPHEEPLGSISLSPTERT